MADRYTTKTLTVDGMTCAACELRINRTLKNMDGVADVSADYGKGTVRVKYNSENTILPHIVKAIEDLHYTVVQDGIAVTDGQNGDKKLGIRGLLCVGIIIFAVYFIIRHTIGFNFIPSVEKDMSLAMLFVIGLITSIHCLSMCGGINLSQSIGYAGNMHPQGRFDKLKPSLLYNAGRVVSYTAVGGVAGALGSVFSLSGTAFGLVAIIAGVFMILMGLNMLNVFPALRKIIPGMPGFIANKIEGVKSGKGPFIVGLFNGFMPCGPLQSVQVYALGTGSAATGALSMFFFSIGTVPLMFAFGAVSTLLSRKFTRTMMAVSAVLVMVLGVVMLNRGFSLSGIDLVGKVADLPRAVTGTKQNAAGNIAEIRDGVQYVSAVFTTRRYEPIVVQAGIPVVWTIDAQSLNGCNNPVLLSEFGKVVELTPGKNTVEFTPARVGTIAYSCWMGMVRSRIVVVESLADLSPEDATVTQSDDGFAGEQASFEFIVGEIQTATMAGGFQEVTVTKQGGTFTPNTIVLQEGVEFKIKFDIIDELDVSNPQANFVMFPEYGGGINLDSQQETPPLPAVMDFAFGDMFDNIVFAKVVTDINSFDKDDVVRGASEYFGR